MLTSSGGSLNADRGEGGKICKNLADVICERSLSLDNVYQIRAGESHNDIRKIIIREYQYVRIIILLRVEQCSNINSCMIHEIRVHCRITMYDLT